MTKKYFGTDGIRGPVNSKNINGDMFFKFGLAAGTFLKIKKKINKQQLLQKILDCQVILWNQLLFLALLQQECMSIHLVHYPQMGLAMLTRSMKANMGIMITASHNPHYDNGLKLFGPNGLKLSDKIEKKIESLIDKKIDNQLTKSKALGRVKRLENGKKST